MCAAPNPGDIFDVKKVRRLIELMKEHDLSELDLKQADNRVRIRRGGEVVAYSAPAVAMPRPAAAEAAAPSAPAKSPAAAAPATPATPATAAAPATPATPSASTKAPAKPATTPVAETKAAPKATNGGAKAEPKADAKKATPETGKK